jgi:UDP-glucose 4-epimerase
MSMKVLVIGGAGYIGSHVVRAFLDRGYRVSVFDNLSSGLRENLFDECAFIHGDILRSDSLEEAMSDGVDALVHLAAFKAAGESMLKPEKYSVNNITGTLNILNAAAKCGVRRIVFSSSAAVYGMPEYLPIDEKHPTNPINYYGFTKLEIERFLGWYDRLKQVRFASLRYFNAAGYDPAGRVRGLEQNPANLLPIIMEVAVGSRERLGIFGDDYDTPDGTCIRDYIHVNDLASAHVMGLEYIDRQDSSLTVNLGTGSGISVKEMLEAARRITGREIPADVTDRRPGDPDELVASAEEAGRLLGWKPVSSDPDVLVRSTWDAYKRSLGL